MGLILTRGACFAAIRLELAAVAVLHKCVFEAPALEFVMIFPEMRRDCLVSSSSRFISFMPYIHTHTTTSNAHGLLLNFRRSLASMPLL